MVLKFFISISETEVLALRWKEGVCSIGGYSRNVLHIEQIVKEYFSETIPRGLLTQKNKLRYDVKMERGIFSAAVASMIEAGITVTQTKTLKRVMF